jgi:osomolarity two-component system sensor histidine kinase NIK1
VHALIELTIQVAQLTIFAAEVTRVSLEVGTEGKLGGQAMVPNVEGTWQVLTDNVNLMVSQILGDYHLTYRLSTSLPKSDLWLK